MRTVAKSFFFLFTPEQFFEEAGHVLELELSKKSVQELRRIRKKKDRKLEKRLNARRKADAKFQSNMRAKEEVKRYAKIRAEEKYQYALKAKAEAQRYARLKAEEKRQAANRKKGRSRSPGVDQGHGRRNEQEIIFLLYSPVPIYKRHLSCHVDVGRRIRIFDISPYVQGGGNINDQIGIHTYSSMIIAPGAHSRAAFLTSSSNSWGTSSTKTVDIN
jgi:hypothetical protein